MSCGEERGGERETATDRQTERGERDREMMLCSVCDNNSAEDIKMMADLWVCCRGLRRLGHFLTHLPECTVSLSDPLYCTYYTNRAVAWRHSLLHIMCVCVCVCVCGSGGGEMVLVCVCVCVCVCER